MSAPTAPGAAAADDVKGKGDKGKASGKGGFALRNKPLIAGKGKGKGKDAGKSKPAKYAEDLKRKGSVESQNSGDFKRKKSESSLAAKFGDKPYDMDQVVVNLANVGASYGKKVLGKDPSRGDRLFDWQGVRACLEFLVVKKGMKCVAVINENFMAADNGKKNVPMPNDILKMCASVQETPRLTGAHNKSADDEMTIRCAFRRNCRFLDNDNYRDWKQQFADEEIRQWLNQTADLLQMRYYFDSECKTFELISGNVPDSMRAAGWQMENETAKKALWTQKRD